MERSRHVDRAARAMERLDLLAQVGRIPGRAGTTRPGLSELEQEACELVASWLELEGLLVTWDGAGNLFGRLEGSDPDAPEIWTGSHLDTVPDGGRFDGALGVIAALEAIDELAASPRRSTLCLVVFRDEEGWRFRSGFFGSRSLCGLVEPSDLAVTDVDGTSVAEALAVLGLEGGRQGASLPGSFVEVHIEQGPVLERSGRALGVVSAIAGMADFIVEFSGETGHAGTVPMAERRDAFVAAADFALRLRDVASALACRGRDGRRRADRRPRRERRPGRVRLTVDVRAPESASLAGSPPPSSRSPTSPPNGLAARPRCAHVVQRAGPALRAHPRGDPRAPPRPRASPRDELPSGAGHDAGVLARPGSRPGMLFVRSRTAVSATVPRSSATVRTSSARSRCCPARCASSDARVGVVAVSGKRTIIAGGTVATDGGVFAADIVIEDGRIAAIADHGAIDGGADELIDATGLRRDAGRDRHARALRGPGPHRARGLHDRHDGGRRRRHHDRHRASAHLPARHDARRSTARSARWPRARSSSTSGSGAR